MATRPKRPTPPPKVGIKRTSFDTLIQDHGQYVRVTPSITCPNRSGSRRELDDTNHPLECPVCDGNMNIDLTDLSEEMWIFMQSVTMKKDFAQNGVFDIKDQLASFPSGKRVGYFYKVELLDLTSQYNEIMFRKAGTKIDKTRFPLKDQEDGSIFSVVDDKGQIYVNGDDYEFEIGDNFIEWGRRRPDDGTLYSFLYPITPTLRVVNLLHEHRAYYEDTKSPSRLAAHFPQQAALRWDYAPQERSLDV